MRIVGVPVQRFLQFCIIGTSGLLVDNAVLFVLVDGIGWPVIGSKVIAAVTAMVNNFFWNDRWTFQDMGEDRRRWLATLKRLFKFHVVCGLGLVIQVGLLHALAIELGLNLYLSNLVAIGVATFWNFGVNYFVSWKGAEE